MEHEFQFPHSQVSDWHVGAGGVQDCERVGVGVFIEGQSKVFVQFLVWLPEVEHEFQSSHDQVSV